MTDATADTAQPMIALPETPGSYIRISDGRHAILTRHRLWMTDDGNMYHPNEIDFLGATVLNDAAADGIVLDHAGDTPQLREKAEAAAQTRWPDNDPALHTQLQRVTINAERSYLIQRQAFTWGARWAASLPNRAENSARRL